MVVTLDTSHERMSALNDALPENKYAMSVMAETSHVPMAGVHTPIGEAVRHVLIAATRLALVVYTDGSKGGGGGDGEGGGGEGGGGKGGGGGDVGDGVDKGGGGNAVQIDPPEDPNAVWSIAAFDNQTAEQSTWLNAVAPVNIVEKSVTETTFHPERSWLNAGHALNMLSIHMTAPTSHEPIGWLNAVAPLNIPPMSVTFATFHAEMSVLNEVFPLNKSDMSVTAETSHVPMAGVHAPTGDAARHVSTAVLSAARVVYTGRGDGGGGDGGGGEGGEGGGGGGGVDVGDGVDKGGGGNAVQTDPPEDPNAVWSSAAFDNQTAEQSTLLNAVAPANIVEKSVTETTFHPERSWLNAGHALNMLSIHMTAPTSHEPIGWLNAVAPLNIPPMSVTFATFHAEMSVLNEVFPLNKSDMSVTAETSHVPMAGVHAPTGDAARHVSTAVLSAARVVYTGRGDGGGGDGGGGEGGEGGGGGGGVDVGDGVDKGGGGNAVQTDPPEDPNAVWSSAAFDNQTAEQSTLLNAVAPANIVEKSVTETTFHPERSWLNAGHALNMLSIHMTAPTSHEPIGWLNAVAPLNIPPMSVTFATFHAEMSVLNEVFPLNKLYISVTAETSHVPMAGVHAPTGDAARHVLTAVLRAALVVYIGRGDGGGGEGGDGGGREGGSAVHTDPPEVTNALPAVSMALFDIHTAEQSTLLNDVAPENMAVAPVIAPTFHAEISWLNADAPWNTVAKFVTCATFHAEMSVLKDTRLLNIECMSVTPETSHVPMAGVHAPTGDLTRHRCTAAMRVSRVGNTHAPGRHTQIELGEPPANTLPHVWAIHAAEQNT